MATTAQHDKQSKPSAVSPRKASRRKIQRDEDIAALIAKAETVKISKKLNDELKEYYVTSRDLVTGKFTHRGISPKFKSPLKNVELINGVLLDIQAYRGRLAEIQGSLLEHSNTLESAKRVAMEFIHERYLDIVRACGSAAMQEVFTDTILEPLIEKHSYVAMLQKRIDLMLKNLENAHFTYKVLENNMRDMLIHIEGGKFSHVKV